MNKQRYIALLKDPSTLSKADIPDLEELIEQFPYCQNAHILLAKVQTEVGSMHAAKLTRKAALYTSDRSKLKRLLNPTKEVQSVNIEATANRLIQEKADEVEATEITETIAPAASIIPEEKSIQIPQKTDIPTPAVSIKLEADKHANNFLSELEENLKALKEAKARAAGVLKPFTKDAVESINKKPEEKTIVIDNSNTVSTIETSVTEYKADEQTTSNISTELPATPPTETIVPPVKPRKPFSALIDAEVPKKDPVDRNDVLDLILSFDNRVKDYFDINEYASKEKTDDIADTPAEERQIADTTETPDDFVLPFTNSDWKLEESRLEEPGQANSDSLLLHYLDYLREQKNKKQKPDKKREKSIISRFIQKDPTISPLSYYQASTEDDDTDGENPNSQTKPSFVSETFAQMLEKQGKIVKAIAVYEELILKNPEKNSYFATRIQELKKKL